MPLVSFAQLALVLSMAASEPVSVGRGDDGASSARASTPTVLPDLGTIRYHDPPRRRAAWLGVDAGGIAVPSATSGIGRRVWSAFAAPTWALALLPRLAIGGRHRVSWYDAGSARLRTHGHQLELSGRIIARRPRLRDRPSVGVEVHDVRLSSVDGVDFRLGGLRDTVLSLGYGLEHDLTPRLQLGWRAHLRQVWVFRDTQRQARVSARLALLPGTGHRLALELVGFYVNRDRDPAGGKVPRNSLHGQLSGEYTWIGARGVGLVVGARYCTSFLSGEAPIYELRTESLRTHYGEVFTGLRVSWE
jgi:hypothetical protein